MATPAQIDAQVKLEREMISHGLQKLRENTRKMEDRSYASATVYGVTCVEALLPLVIERIEQTTHDRLKRGVGEGFQIIKQYVMQLEPMASAAITIKVTLDKVFSTKPNSDVLVTICSAIGKAVEDECQIRHYEKEAPGLLEALKKSYWHSACGTHQKLVVIRTMMNRCEVPPWQTWLAADRVKLGAWLLECLMSTSGWFMRVTEKRSVKDTACYIRPTPEFLSIKDQVMAQAELFSPCAWPMLIPPNPWTAEKKGGYLLNEVMQGHDLVRRGQDGLIQEEPRTFINAIQNTAYTLNAFVVEVAELLFDRGLSVGKFLPIVETPLPPKPWDIADNYDARKDYRRRAAEAMNANASSFKRSVRTRMQMEAVRRFKGVQEFYLPWSFDYRGRAYPIPSVLTPQDTDFGKSLLRFAEESFLNDEAELWLAFQVATTYGLDKAPMQERLDWVNLNHKLITAVATDPLGNISEWEAADEPWQFLAACEEYYACIIDCSRNFTGLPVATDATCSGLQILAGLARDRSTATLVNVIPSDRPQDAYAVVAEVARPNIPERLQPHLDRKKTKRCVMTIPYNAKPYSNRTYVKEAFKEDGIELDKDEATEVVKAIRAAMNQVVPGPMAVMAWIEQEVGNAIKRGAEYFEWTTPSGFKVHQKLNKKEVKTLKLQLLGRVEVNVATGDSDKVDRRHHKNATAPNLIHSLDASLLHLSTIRFNAPIALIHDSVLCRATDMSSLSHVVRETYLHLFAEHDYLRDFADQIGAETDPPIIGDLEPETVLDSTYFFC